ILVRLAGFLCSKRCCPGSQIDKVPVAFVAFGFRSHFSDNSRELVTPAVLSSRKPQLNHRCRREVLLLWNRWRDERLPFNLFTARFHLAPKIVPGPAAAPILLPVEERDDCHYPCHCDQAASQG